MRTGLKSMLIFVGILILSTIFALIFPQKPQTTKGQQVVVLELLEKEKTIEIKARKGAILSRIAQDLGTSWKEMAELNELKNPDIIFPGQKLKVIPFNKTNAKKVSWYGTAFHGKKMSNGEVFDMYDPTIVAHKWLPFGTKVLIEYNDRKITVIVKDRGPYHGNRCFDVSMAAAEKLGIKNQGVTKCKVEILN